MLLNRILLFLIFLLISDAVTAQTIGETRISLKLENVSLRLAMQRIEDITPFKFVARAEDIENKKGVSLDVKDQPLSKILNRIFSGTGLKYKQLEESIIIKKSLAGETHIDDAGISASSSSKRTIHGSVK